MDVSTLKNFNIKEEYYYRGLKILTCIVKDNIIMFSNNDKIKINNDEVFLNNKLISNMPNLTIDDLKDMYIHLLKQKGYKFI